jgi:hypothetical protein
MGARSMAQQWQTELVGRRLEQTQSRVLPSGARRSVRVQPDGVTGAAGGLVGKRPFRCGGA